MQKVSTAQVSTSHTVSRARHPTPLKVPRRPPRSDVTHAIQTFLPYAVAFLLALMVYTSFRSSKPTEYPPYSPPNMLSEDSLPSSIDVAGVLNKRTDRLGEIMKKAQGKVDPGHWASWREKKAAELDEKRRIAEAQWRAKTAEEQWRASGKGEPVVVNEVADWWKQSNAHDFAYDSMYAWRQTVEQHKSADVKDTTSQAAFDMKNRGMTMELLRTQPFNRMMQNNTRMSFTDRLSSLISNVKDSLTSDFEARQGQVSVSERADEVLQQLQHLGDDVIEEIFRKLDMERSECTCPDAQTMCPK